jgi:hypothetical protein
VVTAAPTNDDNCSMPMDSLKNAKNIKYKTNNTTNWHVNAVFVEQVSMFVYYIY